MEKDRRTEVKNPRQRANALSILSFSWTWKLFAKGYKRELNVDDLTDPLQEDRSSSLGRRIVKNWEDEVKRCETRKDGSKPSLFRVLYRCFGSIVLYAALWIFLQEFVLRIIQPFLLARLLRYFSGNKKTWTTDMYYYTTAFCLVPFLDGVVTHWALQTLMHVGMKIRIACCTLIYRKILKLSNSVLDNDTSTGQMVNFLSNDVNRLDFFVFSINYLWIGPLQMMLVTYLIFREIGLGAVTGMSVVAMSIPLQLYLARRVLRFVDGSAKKTDYRLKLMNQIIAGAEVIKMYVWEIPYSLLVENARRKEVDLLKRYSIVTHFGLTFDYNIPRISLFVTILTYVLTGHNIDAEKVFMITSFYTIIRNSMTVAFPMSANQLAEATVSVKRLEKFMMYPERSDSRTAHHRSASQSTPVYLKNVTARWDQFREYTLQDVDLSVNAGNFIVIIGQIGSGKSSLLQAILRELPLEKGVLEVHGKISFADQQPWLFASSVRQNILFGQPVDEARYKEVIRVCQLTSDLASFPHGEGTMVGERGIKLSGGQRARINLARAVYAEADVYLFDDPLSAVDPHVGSRIVEECIRGYLRSKTRILVTHQTQYLKFADQIIVMDNGRVAAKGNFEELQNMNLDVMRIFQKTHECRESKESEDRKEKKQVIEDAKEVKAVASEEPIEVAETRSVGSISIGVLLTYLKASNSMFLLVLTVLCFTIGQGMTSSIDYLVAFWVNSEVASYVNIENGTQWHGPLTRNSIIYIYSGLTVAAVFVYVMQTFLYYEVCMGSSRNLHARMFRSIVRTAMYFYNVNPAGRILNRFSKDIGMIDKHLPFTMMDVILMALTCMGTVVILCSVSFWLLIPTTILTIVLYYMRVIYITTSRAVKRLEGVTRSPVFDHLGATLQGLATIRAFKAEKLVTTNFDNHQDLHSSAWYLFFSCSRAFGLYIETICTSYMSLVTVMFIVFDDLAVAGDIGLVITQIVAIVMNLQWGIRQTAELENNMTSIERVLEYSNLEEEPFLESKPDEKPPEDWPTKGLVEFRNVKLKYEPKGAYVLEDINFVIMPKEKVGVVGRTGAGKTSLISALFRLAYIEGEILIDDIATHTVALQDFRSKISIIPQEPVLFSGSLRRNLDPFDEYSDTVLWEALEQVELKETISDMAAGLNTKVAEDGSNFSVGQRQLLCLVRALIRNNKIMVLDEATANVDPQTDSLIQQTIRKKFMDCTVFTIAHRLNTIMDSDKILVIDRGRLVEFDHPHVLLQKKGYFYDMVQKTGTAMANSLTEVARNFFYRKSEAST
ncbi:putative multidrug resistance-associated protein lethal(2)03659 [Megalopta genalis]|uniref:putative multidrug resistance-associated protein lethal(2)03659 n=1 Tax=Megalopta genalis TaxID=115081 RepID=UPI003FD4E5CA